MMEGDFHEEPTQTLNQIYKMNLDRLNMKVDIDPDEMSRAQLIVDSVNKLVYDKVKIKLPQFKMRSKEPLILQGSVADGTKVLNADEFDYMIPMDLSADQWDIQSCGVNYNKPRIGYLLVEREDHAHKVCNSVVEDRSQFHDAIGLHYNKNMSLHARKDTCSESDKTLLYHRNGLAKIKNKRKAKTCNEKYKTLLYHRNGFAIVKSKRNPKVKKLESENMLLRKKPCIIGGEACEYCRDGNEISSYCVFHGFKASLCELQAYVDSGETFNIDAVSSGSGPAITLSVSYKQSLGSEDSTFKLKIDYAPAMCIDGRYFVPRIIRNWRESFAYEELRLLNEIQIQAPPLFELYKYYKALLTAVDRMSIKADNELNKCNSTDELSFNMTLLDNPTKLVSRLLSDDKPLRLKECLDFNYIILLYSYHLKMILLQMWGNKEKSTVDEEEFVIAVKNTTTDGFIRNYFNGDFLGFVYPAHP